MSDEVADELLAEIAALPAKVLKVNYSHMGMVDLIIANPGISQNAIAAKLGYSASWVSTVMSSDAFQAKLAERSDEILDPVLRSSVKERFEGMLSRSIEILNFKLNAPPDQVPANLALRTFELASRAAGYGARVDPPPASKTEVHVHLESMAENLTRLLSRKKVELLSEEILVEQKSSY